MAPSVNLSSEDLLDHLPELLDERHSGRKSTAHHWKGHHPTQNHRAPEGLPEGAGPEREQGLQVGEGPSGVATHKRTLEAARKARSRRPAREDRKEVMTIMSPLRRPGHVSMEPGDFPAHTAAFRGCPRTPGRSPPRHADCLTSPAGLLSPIIRPSPPGHLCSASTDHPSRQPLPWSHLPDCFHHLRQAGRQQSSGLTGAAALPPGAWHPRPSRDRVPPTPTPASSACLPGTPLWDTQPLTCSFLGLLNRSLVLGALLRAGFPGPQPSLLLALAPLLHPARGWLPERGADYFCPWWGYSLGHPRVGKHFGVDRASVSAHGADPVPHPLTGGSI